MEHKINVEFSSNKTNNNSLNIAIKIKAADIIKSMLKDCDKEVIEDIENIELTVLIEQPVNNSSIETKTTKITKTEYVDALLNDVCDWSGYGSPYNLVILRSSITKFFKYIKYYYYHNNKLQLLNKNLLNKKQQYNSTTKQLPNELIVSDESELFGESPLKTANLKKYISGFKQKEISKWSSKEFVDYVQNKFSSVYGTNLINNFNGNSRNKSAGQVYIGINILKNRFRTLEKSNEEIKKYIDWLFDVKAIKLDFPISIGFITSNKVIDEWIWVTKKQQNQ